jgi:hypothetical protein
VFNPLALELNTRHDLQKTRISMEAAREQIYGIYMTFSRVKYHAASYIYIYIYICQHQRVNLGATPYTQLGTSRNITQITYSADVLIPANSSTRTESLRAFNDNGSGRFLTIATLPHTFFWNEHTLRVGFLI